MNKERIRNRACVVIVEVEKILLVQHRKHGQEYWLLPGGGVEYGEPLQEAAGRELLEETGLQAKVGDLIFLSESIPPDGHRHVINYYFQAQVTGGDICVGHDSQLVAVQWHRLDDLPHMLIYPNIVPELLDWVRRQSVDCICIGNRWDQTP